MSGELEKLEANLGGVSTMKRQPDAVFIVDLRKEQLAVREAQRLGLPVIALVDTNCDPDEATHIVPGNDDAIRSCSLVIRAIADGIASAKTKVTEAELTAPRAEACRSSEPEAPEAAAAAPETAEASTTVEAEAAAEPRARGRARRTGGSVGERDAGVSRDQRSAREGAPGADRRRDDGLQARAPGDRGRPRRGPHAPPRARDGRGRQARGQGHDRGHRPRRQNGDAAAIVGVGCETEPVSKNDAFRAFAARALERVAADGVAAPDELEPERVELVAQLGENIVVVGGQRLEGGTLGSYVHPPANKIGVLVQLEGGTADLARQVAMHISFAAPEYTSRDDVPAETVAAERQIFWNSDEVQSKPEQAREKIVEGMLAKRFFAASPGGTLLDQAWIHDASKSVGAALEEAGATVSAFSRISVAGS